MSSNFGVIVNSNNELVTESFCLPEGICVTEVNHVVAVIRNRKEFVLNQNRTKQKLQQKSRGGKECQKVIHQVQSVARCMNHSSQLRKQLYVNDYFWREKT